MKRLASPVLLAVSVALGLHSECHAFETAFTFQGRLDQNGRPANGLYDFRFALHAAPSGDDPTAPTVTLSQVGVTNGLFIVALDFNVVAFTPANVGFDGKDLWVEAAARNAGSETFIPLSPRQPLTPTPSAVFALTALSVSGVSSNALHAADGHPQNAAFVDGSGNFGIGTTNPASNLHVVSETSAALPPRLESVGTGRFNAGWDFSLDHVGMGYLGVPDFNAPFAPSELLLFGAPGVPVTLWAGGARTLSASITGAVGIGTPAPLAKLEVHGDAKLGESGQFHITGSDENLRIVRGSFNPDGTMVAGAGFSAVRENNEFADYTIQFTTPFAGTPTVTVVCGTDTAGPIAGLVIVNPTTTGCTLRPKPRVFFHQLNRPIHFIAVGPH